MSTEKNYGYEKNYDLDPFDENIDQGYSNTCAIRSQEIVLRDYGIMIPQEKLMTYAEQHGWYDSDPNDGGTPMEAVGNLLNACGIETVAQDNCNVFDLVAELKQGHRIIVGVDANELWSDRNGETWNKMANQLQDQIDGGHANHALVVAGVRVNPDDPTDVHVILTDPGTGDMCIEYTLEEFKDAWEDSNCFMVSTTQPAPYQYNAETHQMEPSQFATDFMPSQIVMPNGLPNEFELPEDFYDVFDDYCLYYSAENIDKMNNDDDSFGHQFVQNNHEKNDTRDQNDKTSDDNDDLPNDEIDSEEDSSRIDEDNSSEEEAGDNQDETSSDYSDNSDDDFTDKEIEE